MRAFIRDSRLVCGSSWSWIGAGLLAGLGCGGDGGTESQAAQVPETYEFASRFEPSTSAVSYGGQTFQQVLIEAIDGYVGGLTQRIDSGKFKPKAGEVKAALEGYFGAQAMGGRAIELDASLPLLQSTFSELGASESLRAGFAGHDDELKHAAGAPPFEGHASATSAEALLLSLFEELDTLAVARARGEYEIDAETPVFVTAEGLDLREFISKMLLMGTAYTRLASSKLDEQIVAAANAQMDEGGKKQPFSALEHAWDAGFGYFGAARDFGDYSDDELAMGVTKDSNGDGKIDLTSEFNFALAVYAGKRDRGSQAKTEFTSTLWDAFLEGRAVLAGSDGERLESEEKTALLRQRNLIVRGVESVVVASIVHYLNESIASLTAAKAGEFSLTELAEPFSELKAFALGLQFNLRMGLAKQDFVTFHTLIRDVPVLPEAGEAAIDAYVADLLRARAILARTYKLDPKNVGDDQGQGGW